VTAEAFAGSTDGSPNEKARQTGEPQSSNFINDNNLQNSRGGTRTRDPGIMSAVL
jgi:hypothetical protein